MTQVHALAKGKGCRYTVEGSVIKIMLKTVVLANDNIQWFSRAVGCIFGELLNNSPLFPVSTVEFF